MTGTLRAGIVGLGIIGGGIARSLHRSGMPAVGYDVRPEAIAALRGFIDAANSPADVARRSDVVHLAVLDYAQLLEVLRGPDGVIAGSRPGTTVVVLSTISPALIPTLVDLTAPAGIELLDCGVIGSDDRAGHNALVATVGGDAAALVRAHPVLDAWAGQVIRCGRSGTGMTVKVGRNAVTFGMWRALEEVTRTLVAAGVPQDEFIAALRASDPDGDYLYRQRQLIGGFAHGSTEREHAIVHGREIMTKDAAAFADLARGHDVPTPLMDLVEALIDDSLDGHVAPA